MLRRKITGIGRWSFLAFDIAAGGFSDAYKCAFTDMKDPGTAQERGEGW